MLVYLHVEQGPHSGRRIDLKHGQTAIFGSSDFSDFCFAEDQQMAAKHFQISIENNQCSLVHLANEYVSLVNSEEVATANLSNKDTVLAGQTCFRVYIENQTVNDTSAVDIDSSEIAHEKIDLKERCICIKLSDAALEFCGELETREELFEILKSNCLYQDAIRLLIDILGSPVAIKWANQIIGNRDDSNLQETDREALAAVTQWVEDPTEDNRRKNESQSKELEYSGVGGALAAAVFFSGGSIGPPELEEEIEPDPYSAGQAIAVALLLTAFDADPVKPEEQFKLILETEVPEIKK